MGHIRPNFLVLGSQKAGTTSLHQMLSLHPQVFLPREKEVFFFTEHQYHLGAGWYADFFRDVREETAIGEISPTYISEENAPRRIRDFCGKDVRLVVMLRNPVERAYSAFNMFRQSNRRLHWTHGGLVEAFFREHSGKQNSAMINQGLYFRNIQRFLEFFEPEQIHLIFFDEFTGGSRQRVFHDLLGFLQVGHLDFIEPRHANKGATLRFSALRYAFGQSTPARLSRSILNSVPLVKKVAQRALLKPVPRLDDETKQVLTDMYFREDIEALEELTGKDLNSWKSYVATCQQTAA